MIVNPIYLVEPVYIDWVFLYCLENSKCLLHQFWRFKDYNLWLKFHTIITSDVYYPACLNLRIRKRSMSLQFPPEWARKKRRLKDQMLLANFHWVRRCANTHKQYCVCATSHISSNLYMSLKNEVPLYCINV